MIKGADLKLFEKGLTCTCKVQGKGEYLNTISQGGLSLDSDFVGRANYDKVDWRIYSLVPDKEGVAIGQEKESVMHPPDLPLNVFKCCHFHLFFLG